MLSLVEVETGIRSRFCGAKLRAEAGQTRNVLM